MISLKTHNIMDYVVGAVLILAPYIFGFAGVDAARNVFGILGVSLIVYSLLTNYQYSLSKTIPLGVHMGMDVASGFILLVAPWLFGYHNDLTTGQMWLNTLLGLGAIGMVAATRQRTDAIGGFNATRDNISDITRRAA